MEAKFIVVQKITKALCREFAATLRKRFPALLLLGVILLLLGAALCILGGATVAAVSGLVLGGVLLLIDLFAAEINGAAIYNSMNPHVLACGVRYAFFDDRFETSDAAEYNRTSYATILKIVETDAAFFLYVTKASALIVDKAGFKVGTADAFRAFLTEKTGLAITRRRHKVRTKNKAIAVVAAVAVIASGLTAYGVRSAALRRQPKIFSVGEISVALTAGFSEKRRTEEDGYVEVLLGNGNTDIYLYNESLPYVFDENEPLCTDAESYAACWYQYYKEDSEYYENAELFRRADGSYRLTYTYYDGSWVYCEIIGQSGDNLWIVGFDYPAQSKETVERFMDTVKIGSAK